MGDELRSRLSDVGQAELQAAARDPTPGTRSCTRRGVSAGVAAIVVLGLLAAVVIVIAVRKKPPETPTNNDYHEYAIMLDAGSSGTRAHVYSWPASSSCPERIAQRQVTERGGDGKSTADDAGGLDVQTAQGVAGYLQPLLDFAQETVPNDCWSATPIQLQATAGLRKMPGEHDRLQTTVPLAKSGGAVVQSASSKYSSMQSPTPSARRPSARCEPRLGP